MLVFVLWIKKGSLKLSMYTLDIKLKKKLQNRLSVLDRTIKATDQEQSRNLKHWNILNSKCWLTTFSCTHVMGDTVKHLWIDFTSIVSDLEELLNWALYRFPSISGLNKSYVNVYKRIQNSVLQVSIIKKDHIFELWRKRWRDR